MDEWINDGEYDWVRCMDVCGIRSPEAPDASIHQSINPVFPLGCGKRRSFRDGRMGVGFKHPIGWFFDLKGACLLNKVPEYQGFIDEMNCGLADAKMMVMIGHTKLAEDEN
jgi:hypothetical protein